MQVPTQPQPYSPESAQESRKKIGVIGAGAIGICAASWLLHDGHDVVVIDPDGIGNGASFGNAGCLNSSSVVPMSLPGVVWKVPGWLLDPLGPLAIRPAYLPRLAPWLLRFLQASRTELVRGQVQALTGLLADAPGAYAPLVSNAGAQDLLRHNGHIVAYRARQDFENDSLAWQLRRDAGIRFDVLHESELWQMEPEISRNYKLGVLLPDNAYTVNPQSLVRALGERFLRDGGRLSNAKVLDFNFAGSALQSVLTDEGDLLLDAVVVAAGAHSRPLAQKAGDDVMLDTERGYHVMIKDPEAMPRHSILDAAGKFVATPMEHGLRLAGTVEFAGLQAVPDWRRADRLQVLGRRLFPGLQERYPEARLSRWMGFRPSMPDSLPVIGPARRSGDVIYAFGHGHIGLASAARTGRLVAELIGGRPPHLDIAPFSAQRFN
jgi:D-amino-acid dehydrogenase